MIVIQGDAGWEFVHGRQNTILARLDEGFERALASNWNRERTVVEVHCPDAEFHDHGRHGFGLMIGEPIRIRSADLTMMHLQRAGNAWRSVDEFRRQNSIGPDGEVIEVPILCLVGEEFLNELLMSAISRAITAFNHPTLRPWRQLTIYNDQGLPCGIYAIPYHAAMEFIARTHSFSVHGSASQQ